MKTADSPEELQDIYLHFRLYYGQDVAAMHEQEINKKKEEKKLQPKKKRIVSPTVAITADYMTWPVHVGADSTHSPN